VASTSYQGAPQNGTSNNVLEWSGDTSGTETVDTRQDHVEKIVVGFFSISRRTSAMKMAHRDRFGNRRYYERKCKKTAVYAKVNGDIDAISRAAE